MNPDENNVADDSPNTPVVTAEVPTAPGRPVEIDRATLEKLAPPEKKAAIELVQSRSFSFSGPLPPPDLLAKYDQALPGAMDRIFKMAESQQAHSQVMDRRAILFTYLERLGGQLCGLLIGLFALGGCFYTAINGQPGVAAAIGITSIASLVGVFVYGRKTDAKAERTD